MMAESWHSGHRICNQCSAMAGEHVSTATKTRSHASNTLAIARQQPA
jgi:hypothetical protein